jgi:hypothetical protein
MTTKAMSARARRDYKQAMKGLLWSMTEGRCWYCGATMTREEVQIEHLVPVARGGSSSLANLVPACRDCSHSKGAASLADFRINFARRTVSGPPFSTIPPLSAAQQERLREHFDLDLDAFLADRVPFWFEREGITHPYTWRGADE